MAITHQAVNGEKVTVEPDDPRGPWTIELPDAQELPANNNWQVHVKAIGFGATPITITATGTASIEDANLGQKQPSVSTVFVGNSVEFTYNSGRNTWNVYRSASAPTHTAILYGTPATLTNVGTTPQAVDGWAGGDSTPFFDVAPQTGTGAITIPKNGIYMLNMLLLCEQSGSNKEFAYIASVQRSATTDLDLAAFQVATDKTPRVRSLTCSFPLVGTSGDEWNLAIRAEGAGGQNLNFSPCGFSVTLMYATQ